MEVPSQFSKKKKQESNGKNTVPIKTIKKNKRNIRRDWKCETESNFKTSIFQIRNLTSQYNVSPPTHPTMFFFSVFFVVSWFLFFFCFLLFFFFLFFLRGYCVIHLLFFVSNIEREITTSSFELRTQIQSSIFGHSLQGSMFPHHHHHHRHPPPFHLPACPFFPFFLFLFSSCFLSGVLSFSFFSSKIGTEVQTMNPHLKVKFKL